MLTNRQKRLIDNSTIVSFDIFDTIIERMVVNPSDVFDIVEKEYNNSNVDNINGFKLLRIQSEKEARLRLKKEEVTLDDIYTFLSYKNEKINIEQLKKLEECIEIKVCQKLKRNQEILDYCYKNNKEVIITSDMYLSKTVIQEILKRNRIKYDKLYLSSDIMKTKARGTLYKYIIADYNIPANKILHIGDNKKSDYIMAKANGLKCILINNKRKKSYNNVALDYSMCCVENDINKNGNDYFYNFGYKYLGVLMFNFCKFLHNNVKSKDSIIFLAREGQFMKKCYDRMYEDNNSQYMYVSRKSVSSALLCYFNDINEMIKAQSLSPNETIETFLKRWDIINNETIILLSQNNIDIKKHLFDKNEIIKLQNILEKLKIKSNAIIKNEVFEKYLEQFNISNNSSLVDIGWSGTMHDLIQHQLTLNNITVNSFYLGVRGKKKNNYKHGFVFDGKEDDIEILSRSMTGFLEILFSADHGTTLGYKKDNDKIAEILAKNDIDEPELEQIKMIQKGCLDFINKYKNDSILLKCDYSNCSYKPLFDFCINPKTNDINKFKNFCVVDENEYSLIGNRYGIGYMFHLRSFVNDYVLSCWKNAYLKSILKINLPYNLLFKFAYKRRH